MSDLIEQLRALRGIAHKRLTESPDYKVLIELDQMLVRLDPEHDPVMVRFDADSVIDDIDATEEDEGAEDPEAASPRPEEQPPPKAAEEPKRKEVLLAVDASDEAEADESDDVIVADFSDGGNGALEVDVATLPDEGLSGDVLAGDGVAADERDGSTELVDDTDLPPTDDGAPLAEEEAAFAEALAEHLKLDVATPRKERELPKAVTVKKAVPAKKVVKRRVKVSDLDAATEVAAALLDTGAPAPAKAKPSPVALAPEENFDAAEADEGGTSDEAYESALNRLNLLIERASTRLKADEKKGSNGASVA